MVQELESTIILLVQGAERAMEVLLQLLHNLRTILVSQLIQCRVRNLDSLGLKLLAEDARINIGHWIFGYYGINLVKSIGLHDFWT